MRICLYTFITTPYSALQRVKKPLVMRQAAERPLVGYIVALLDDPNVRIRDQAAMMLRYIGEDPDVWTEWWQQAKVQRTRSISDN